MEELKAFCLWLWQMGHPVVIGLGIIGVVLSTVPVLTGAYQFLLVPMSLFATDLTKTGAYYPRVSILIPAWNEGAVIGATIDRLMQLNYPKDKLRIYVIDDGSSDETPLAVIERHKTHPENVFHIRRVAGGEGKAHTLNYGLEVLWRGSWTEAVLIMDADVIYTADALSRMTRHLADPSVGAVTAYIKEGSKNPNYVQKFITFEYVTATGASRRAQNVLGFLACLSGGAQLHSRENLMAIGGQIFSDTLAEDTFTTFRTQLAGRRAIFDPHAIVLAEEPDNLVGLWKQRLRWARGNVQISFVFKELWFNRRLHASMGSISMGLIWFALFLMPALQIGATISLITLYFVDQEVSWQLFRMFWIVAGITYLLITTVSMVMDSYSIRKSWLQGILFPGVVSLAIIVFTLFPPLYSLICGVFNLGYPNPKNPAVLLLYAWVSFGMLVTYAAMRAEQSKRFSWLAPVLLHLGGYGSFLCAITFASYIKELMKAELKWDKTEKTGKVN